jgi:hypothetical protein
MTEEMQGLIDNGARPIAPRDRHQFYDLVSASLAKCPY